MIYYIDGVPHKNIRLHKTKAHAVQNYRNKEQRKETKAMILSILMIVAVTAYYLIIN